METRGRARAAFLGLGLVSGCLRPNPLYGTSAGTTSGASNSSTDTAEATGSSTSGLLSAGATTDVATTAASASASSASTSGVTTGPVASYCGDEVLDPEETCDDGNEDPSDGCVACAVPRTCAEILALAPGSPSGTYLIDPNASGAPWPATCDMELDGGGWTGFDVQDVCDDHLAGQIAVVKAAESFTIDAECRPASWYGDNGGEFAYLWDIAFTPGFSAFFLRGYEVKAIGEPELKFEATLWTSVVDFPNGSLSLGDGHAEGPAANWAGDGGMVTSFVDGQILPYPLQDVPFVLQNPTDLLRIGWGDIGVDPDGLYPWWSGQIFVR